MAILTNHNCVVDANSGGVVFTGSPELRAIRQLKSEILQLHAKMDTVIELLKGVDDDGRKMAQIRFNESSDAKI